MKLSNAGIATCLSRLAKYIAAQIHGLGKLFGLEK